VYVDEIIENVRRLSRDLSPAVLEEMGLSSALRYLLEEFQEYHPTVSYQEDIDEIDEAFSEQNQIFIYRIFQESLTNIFKHAQASQITVAAKKQDGQVAFAVQDNGQGFDVDRVLGKEGSAKGLGMAAIQERVRMIGGVLEVWSQAGQGTRISFAIPSEGSSTDESALSHRPG
jgi:signal transduction histidine kinase